MLLKHHKLSTENCGAERGRERDRGRGREGRGAERERERGQKNKRKKRVKNKERTGTLVGRVGSILEMKCYIGQACSSPHSSKPTTITINERKLILSLSHRQMCNKKFGEHLRMHSGN